jgi:hypothetical protein
METIIISVIVAVIVVILAYFYFKKKGGVTSPVAGPQVLQNTATDGKKQTDTRVSLPESYNQPEGMAMSYTAWIKIDDFAYRYGEKKVIFTKGPSDLSSMCPALMIDPTTNSLLVTLDTFGGQEIIPISNVPAKKWLHIGIAINQEAVDVYVNGTLYTHHTLIQLPKQNNSTVQLGVGGGFDGKIASLQYFNYFLTPSDISSIMATKPQIDVNDLGGPLPPYFDESWWTSH